MTPHCCNCLHWDEETIEDTLAGQAICGLWSAYIESPKGLRRLAIIRTSGDESCPQFCPKRVTNAPTQVTSEAE